MLTTRPQSMALLGLGDSPNTTAEGLVAEVVVVRTFEELDGLKDEEVNSLKVWHDYSMSR